MTWKRVNHVCIMAEHTGSKQIYYVSREKLSDYTE